jgi:hypothetical protein
MEKLGADGFDSAYHVTAWSAYADWRSDPPGADPKPLLEAINYSPAEGVMPAVELAMRTGFVYGGCFAEYLRMNLSPEEAVTRAAADAVLTVEAAE